MLVKYDGIVKWTKKKRKKGRICDCLKAPFLANGLQLLRKGEHEHPTPRALQAGAGGKDRAEPRYHASPALYPSKQPRRKDRGDKASLSEHHRTLGSWPLQRVPWAGPPSVRNLTEMAGMRSISHFPHAPVLRGNLLCYFSCISNREGGYTLIHCLNTGGRKGAEHLSPP